MSAGSERKIAKIVCRLIKRKQNLPINEMWQLSVNFIGARLAGDADADEDDDDDDDTDAGWRHLATHPTPSRRFLVALGVGGEAEAEAFLPCLDVDSCDTHLQALPDIGDGVSMAGSSWQLTPPAAPAATQPLISASPACLFCLPHFSHGGSVGGVCKEILH